MNPEARRRAARQCLGGGKSRNRLSGDGEPHGPVFHFQEAAMTYLAMMRRLSFLLLGVVACSPRSDAKKAATTSGGSAASTLVPITTTSAEARQHYLTGL